MWLVCASPSHKISLDQKKCGRVTPEGEERLQLQQGGGLSRGRRLDGKESREAIAAINALMELLRSLQK